MSPHTHIRGLQSPFACSRSETLRRAPPPSCSPVTNLLDGDPRSAWRAEGAGRQFVIFDLTTPFTLTKMVLVGNATKMMPKDYQLEVSPSSDGPWRVIAGGEAEVGEGDAKCQSILEGFVATSRFWKLQILRNHGAKETKLNTVSFHGVDHLMKKFFVEHGIAQVSAPAQFFRWPRWWLATTANARSDVDVDVDVDARALELTSPVRLCSNSTTMSSSPRGSTKSRC